MRGLELRKLTVLSVDAVAKPPCLVVEIALAGTRYIEDRDTLAPLTGSSSRSRDLAERWVLQLDGPALQPWCLASVVKPTVRGAGRLPLSIGAAHKRLQPLDEFGW